MITNNQKKCLLIIIITLILFVVVFLTITHGKGTFSADTSVASVNITCPESTHAGSDIACDVYLNVADGEKVDGISAVYNFADFLTYSEFTPSRTCPEESETCIFYSSENGFLIGDIQNGFTGNALLGSLKLTVSADVYSGNSLSIGLKEISISSGEDVESALADASTNINIVELVVPPTFDESLTVDEENKIIKRILVDTTYSTIKSKINATVSITDKDDNAIDDTATAKTGDKIIANGVTYTVSVLGDVSGSGIRTDIADMSTAYNAFKGTRILSELEKSACDLNDNGEIDINDIVALYSYYKGRLKSLEGYM